MKLNISLKKKKSLR